MIYGYIEKLIAVKSQNMKTVKDSDSDRKVTGKERNWG